MPEIQGVGRTLTQLDFVRLCKLNGGSLPDILEAGPVVADLVDAREVPPDVVTMYSQIEIRQHGSGQVSRLTLVYPADAEPVAGFVSVLSPVGASLLGLRVGDTATWDTPHGEACSAEILAILFQPEASGDYTT
ncbi:GreA/GreB family elongation factor [Hydrogenophaga bisanensis]|uniref:GreA/GreB family elongation factor n=1 Tax=Hydrogenophaga bisanensis TaxID=439611 RepID=A0ABW2R6G1_9BURK|nr:GreA/GreB family elongation factor [Hydrogenophaga sp.]MDI3510373.1 regulator of nucleoside diphosphate kinase [Betaproteobacteria bacterium]